jgi:hypothetical protein
MVTRWPKNGFKFKLPVIVLPLRIFPLLIPLGRVLLEKLAVTQVVKNSIIFIELKDSLPSPEQTVSVRCSEADKSILRSETLIYRAYFKIQFQESPRKKVRKNLSGQLKIWLRFGLSNFPHIQI